MCPVSLEMVNDQKGSAWDCLPVAFRHHSLLALQSSTTSLGLCRELEDGAGMAGQASTDTLPWGKAPLGQGCP